MHPRSPGLLALGLPLPPSPSSVRAQGATQEGVSGVRSPDQAFRTGDAALPVRALAADRKDHPLNPGQGPEGLKPVVTAYREVF